MFAPLGFFLATFLVVSSFGAPDTLFPTRTSHNDLVDRSNPLDVVLTPLPKLRPAAHLTNAQRLSRGLPPNRPRAYHGHRKAVRPRQSSTCPQKTGTIAVNIADLGAGYVARSANSFGEYTFTTDPAEVLSVSIPQCETASGFFEIAPLDDNLDQPYLGGTVGFASTSNDLQPDSLNYVYLTATNSVPRGPATFSGNSFSDAVGSTRRDSESAIWALDTSNRLTPSWVNTDGSTPAVALVFVPSSGAYALVGGVDAFVANVGSANNATFTFVPSS
ncbi:hypothetical protein C8Q74DRAFT_372225 [Fomes fomentarius]|nr:hypothetical protein C8Q74DRAFT_372225 [Fomes fomentarius]